MKLFQSLKGLYKWKRHFYLEPTLEFHRWLNILFNIPNTRDWYGLLCSSL